MVNDFYPYYLRSGDEFPKNEPFVFGELVNVVELPPSWGLDDFPPLEYVWGMNQGPNTPSQVRELWQGEFDYMVENCPGGMYVLTCHPQFIGRGSRLKMFDELVDHMKGDGRTFRDARRNGGQVPQRESSRRMGGGQSPPHGGCRTTAAHLGESETPDGDGLGRSPRGRSLRGRRAVVDDEHARSGLQ